MLSDDVFGGWYLICVVNLNLAYIPTHRRRIANVLNAVHFEKKKLKDCYQIVRLAYSVTKARYAGD